MQEEQKKLLVFDFNGTLEGNNGLYEGVPEMLRELHESDQYHMVILSMGARDDIKGILNQESELLGLEGANNLNTYFDAVYGADEIAKANGGPANKTNPHVLDDMVNTLGVEVSREESIVIGDTFAEHLLAKRADIGFLYAGWHDAARDKPVKSGLMALPPSQNTGYVELTQQDVASAKTVDDVAEVTKKLATMQKKKEPSVPADPDLER